MSPWKRTFISAFVAQIFSIFGFSFALPFLPYFIEELGVSDPGQQAWWAGIVMGAAGATLAVFSPIWGILADRYGRKLMVMRSMFAGTVVMTLMSVVQTVGQLVACRLLQGALTGTVAASVALVASVAPPKRSGFALGMMQTAVFVGVALGPLLGGIVADTLGYRIAFRVGAILLLVGGLLVYYGTRENFTRPSAEQRANSATFRQILSVPGFLIAVVVLFSIRFSNTVSNPSFPLIVKEMLGPVQTLNSVTGSIVFCAAVAGAVSSGVFGHFGDTWGHKRILLACSLCASVVSAWHAYAGSVAQLYVLRTLFGLAVAGMIPAANAMIRHNTPAADIGKAYGAATALSMLGLAGGPFIGGFIGRTWGLRAPFLVTGAGQVVVLILVAILVRDHMLRPSEAPAPPVENA